MNANTEKAINILMGCRQTHVDWKRFIEEFPEEASKPRPEVETAGDIEHHQRCIDDYDFVLKVLQEMHVDTQTRTQT